jgi:hypothetical protein
MMQTSLHPTRRARRKISPRDHRRGRSPLATPSIPEQSLIDARRQSSAFDQIRPFGMTLPIVVSGAPFRDPLWIVLARHEGLEERHSAGAANASSSHACLVGRRFLRVGVDLPRPCVEVDGKHNLKETRMRSMLTLLLFLTLTMPAHAVVEIEWVTVGDPDNACDPQPRGCFGSVADPGRFRTRSRHRIRFGTTTPASTSRVRRTADRRRWPLDASVPEGVAECRSTRLGRAASLALASAIPRSIAQERAVRREPRLKSSRVGAESPPPLWGRLVRMTRIGDAENAA